MNLRSPIDLFECSDDPTINKKPANAAGGDGFHLGNKKPRGCYASAPVARTLGQLEINTQQTACYLGCTHITNSIQLETGCHVSAPFFWKNWIVLVIGLSKCKFN